MAFTDYTGFKTTFPTTDPAGDSNSDLYNIAIAEYFVCGGSGVQDVNKIGGHTLSGDGTPAWRFWLSNAGSADPGNATNIVTNSLTPAFTCNVANAWTSYTYSTKPQLTGGASYWIVGWGNSLGSYYILLEDQYNVASPGHSCACTYHATNTPAPGTWGPNEVNHGLAAEYQAAAAGGRTTKNTASNQLGQGYGMNFGIPR